MQSARWCTIHENTQINIRFTTKYVLIFIELTPAYDFIWFDLLKLENTTR